jgi:hypothetical protein
VSSLPAHCTAAPVQEDYGCFRTTGYQFCRQCQPHAALSIWSGAPHGEGTNRSQGCLGGRLRHTASTAHAFTGRSDPDVDTLFTACVALAWDLQATAASPNRWSCQVDPILVHPPAFGCDELSFYLEPEIRVKGVYRIIVHLVGGQVDAS